MTDNDKYFKVRFKKYSGRDKVWGVVTDYLNRYVPPNSTVLDLGAGYCEFINNIKAKEKHAIDLFNDIDKYAAKDVVVHKQSVTKMDDLGSSHFDVVFASNIFEHLSSDELDNVIHQIRRVLKDYGRLIIMQPNFKYAFKVYFDDYTHKQIFTAMGLSGLLEAHDFVIEKRMDRFLPFTMGSKLPKARLLVWLYLRSPVKPLAGQMLIVAGCRKKE